ncbi:DNA-processing protein DprA [Pyxidicoccus xibeiensis]|uniref:DNA-processing protein DprA n=1 Tax=Pyxidicoccus xibeiensis TaxID=2906759 RepID=UPI0020A70911|nr:DNA-processing protein DprA [Pyxidicoccus xibeiensis]MCP3136466.1 DNA-protecting protein DprA [Pyxidicoccus xibeiensis]
MSAAPLRRESAYWLTLAFKLEREPRRAINGLVLTADRRLKVGLSALVKLEPEELPTPLQRYADVHQHLLEADGKVSAQAFVVDRLMEEGIDLVPITRGNYPAHLARTLGPDKAPTLLSVAGDVALLREQGVAVSGSRDAGAEGLAFARAMGRSIAEAGFVLVSGLARGCDREALEGALEAGGRVIGVAPEGILHSSARRRPEVEAGRLVVVSEFAPNDKWAVGRAMARNKTIAGFSRALVVADCVAPGGTTDQVEVTRSLGLPVFMRRGRGEGALVAELVQGTGVTALHWDEGPVQLPELLGVRPRTAGIRCDIRLQQERLVVHVEGSSRATLDDVVSAVREAWSREYALSTEAPSGMAAAEPAPTLGASSVSVDPMLAQLEASDGSQKEETEAAHPTSTTEQAEATAGRQDRTVAGLGKRDKTQVFDSLMLALRNAGASGCSVKELEQASGCSDKLVRRYLSDLEGQGAVVPRRKPVPHRFFLKEHAPAAPPSPSSEASANAETLKEEGQLGLAFDARGTTPSSTVKAEGLSSGLGEHPL